MDEKPPTWREPKRPYEAEDVPWTSKTVEGAEPRPMKNPARLIVKLASKVMEFVNSSKSNESEAKPTPQERVPEPLVLSTLPDEPSDEGQVYVTPLNVVAPEMEAVPETSMLEDRIRDERVLAPDTVRVSETRLLELRVKGPIPLVLVGGN